MRAVCSGHTGGMFLLLCVLLLRVLPEPAVSPLPDARFVADLREKKIDDVLGLYTANAVFVNPDGSVAHAGPELRKLYEQVTGAMDSDLHLHLETIQQMGRNVEESGSYTETLRHRDTGRVEKVKGTYLFIGRREVDGQYRYTRMEWY